MTRIFAILLILFTTTGYAQSEKYMETMKKNLARFDSVKTSEEYQSLAATFERIGDAEKTEWLPYYYSSIALLTPGWTDTKIDKDANAAKIKSMLDKADLLAKENADKAELLSVRNMAATQQMLVDPQNRWMSYGQEGANYLKQAKDLDPDNPRLAYLEGAGIFGTPEQFGGGKAKAKPVLEKAVSLFKAAQPNHCIHNGDKR
jgi:ribosomal protein L29